MKWLAWMMVLSASVAHAQVVETVAGPRELSVADGPADPRQAPVAPPEDRRDTVGFRIFGAHTGAILMGSLALPIAAASGDSETGLAVLYPTLMMTVGGAVLMHRQARKHRWNPRIGSALAGFYPGLVQGVLTGMMLTRTADLQATERRFALLGSIAASTFLSMGLHSRTGGRALRRGVGLFYVLIAGAALAALPFARAYDEPRAIGWASAVGGALSMVLTGTKRW
ncbi:MAG: hypothetical protein AAGE52_16110 [Myxococcota bacterium]